MHDAGCAVSKRHRSLPEPAGPASVRVCYCELPLTRRVVRDGGTASWDWITARTCRRRRSFRCDQGADRLPDSALDLTDLGGLRTDLLADEALRPVEDRITIR